MPTLLAIIPHPDDEAYSFGGTIALAAKAGWRCIVHCASAGEGGERHDGVPAGPMALAAARTGELRSSCRVLGARPPTVWGLPDGELAGLASEAPRIRGLFEALQPDLVLALGPDGAYGHPDHVAVSRWVLEAWTGAPAKPPLLFAAFPKGLFLPQYEKCIGMLGDPPEPPREAIGSESSDYEVDVSAVRETKLAAITAHRTQLPGGDPRALFPEGIVEGLLDVEWFTDARGSRDGLVAELLGSLG